jgi:hypothetical protein
MHEQSSCCTSLESMGPFLLIDHLSFFSTSLLKSLQPSPKKRNESWKTLLHERVQVGEMDCKMMMMEGKASLDQRRRRAKEYGRKAFEIL